MEIGLQGRNAETSAAITELKGKNISNVIAEKSLPLYKVSEDRRSRVAAIVTIAEGTTRADLEAEGMTVATIRGNMAIVTLDCTDAERVASLPAIERFSLSRNRSMKMDNALPASGVDKVHAGEGLDKPYTGKNVIVGVVDQGLDPNHLNFCNADGSSRFKFLSHIYESARSPQGYEANYYGTDVQGKDITTFTSDSYETYHGTHTLGILTGSYSGDVAGVNNATIVNPYTGVAPGADIAASCGTLNDLCIALGVDGIISYSEYAQKPAVVSLSLGSNTGSHSERSQMNRFLDVCAEDATIVISAGNEGDLPLACCKTLTETDNELKTFISSTIDYEPCIRYGQIYVYSQKEFSLQGVIYNTSRGKIAYRMPASDAAGEYVVYAPKGNSQSGEVASQQFLNAFSEGYVAVAQEYDENSQEYVGIIQYYVMDNADTNPDFNYILGFVVTGTQAGQRIESYAGGSFSALTDWNQEGWDTGSYDGTINDMACGLKTISVGSYNTRDTYPVADGVASYEGRFPYGEITFYSSWGTLADGRSLPTICAPGAAIVSSMNGYYINALDDYYKYLNISATAKGDSRDSHWGPSHGTSMAAPHVAGGIALCLEADPTLTSAEVRDILVSTACRDEAVESGNPVQWGAGKFDAYAALKETIRRRDAAGINTISTDTPDPLMIKYSGNDLQVFLGGVEDMTVELLNLSGIKVAEVSTHGDEAALNTSGLAKGVYILRVNNRLSKRIIL